MPIATMIIQTMKEKELFRNWQPQITGVTVFLTLCSLTTAQSTLRVEVYYCYSSYYPFIFVTQVLAWFDAYSNDDYTDMKEPFEAISHWQLTTSDHKTPCLFYVMLLLSLLSQRYGAMSEIFRSLLLLLLVKSLLSCLNTEATRDSEFSILCVYDLPRPAGTSLKIRHHLQVPGSSERIRSNDQRLRAPWPTIKLRSCAWSGEGCATKPS